jgi:hypothetical protein
VDYFTVLLTGISGIFVNNLPLSFSTALAHRAKPPNANIPGLFRYFVGKNLRDLRKLASLRLAARRPPRWIVDGGAKEGAFDPPVV